LPLTVRPVTLAHHAGQISLPGGRVETGESSFNAALRELNEELGFCATHMVVGRLTDCYVYASDFLVTPWIIANLEADTCWRPHASEVQSVVEMPLAILLDERSQGRATITRGPLIFDAPCYHFGPSPIWGATSIILSELAGALLYLAEND
jgi:hypothetical protein